MTDGMGQRERLQAALVDDQVCVKVRISSWTHHRPNHSKVEDAKIREDLPSGRRDVRWAYDDFDTALVEDVGSLVLYWIQVLF